MKTVSVSEARKRLHIFLDQEEKILLINHDKIVGIIIPFNVEDAIDSVNTKRIEKKNKFIQWGHSKKKIEL